MAFKKNAVLIKITCTQPVIKNNSKDSYLQYNLLTHSVSCSEACPFCKLFLSVNLDLHSSLEQSFCAIQEPASDSTISTGAHVSLNLTASQVPASSGINDFASSWGIFTTNTMSEGTKKELVNT